VEHTPPAPSSRRHSITSSARALLRRLQRECHGVIERTACALLRARKRASLEGSQACSKTPFHQAQGSGSEPDKGYRMARSDAARARLRPWVAMAAAYAVVLQMLFAGIAASRVNASAADPNGDSFVICYGERSAPVDNQLPADHPLHQQHCVLCSVAAAAPAATLPTAPGHIASPIISDLMRWPKASAFLSSQRSTPRLSQGPPQTA
jgi:hypothetical protein